MIDHLPTTGYLRLAQILGPRKRAKNSANDEPERWPLIPMSYASWHDGVAKGLLPAPVKLTPGTALYRVEDIRYLIEHGSWTPEAERESMEGAAA